MPLFQVKTAQEALTDMPPRSEQVRTHSSFPLSRACVCVCAHVHLDSLYLHAACTCPAWRKKQLIEYWGGDVGVRFPSARSSLASAIEASVCACMCVHMCVVQLLCAPLKSHSLKRVCLGAGSSDSPQPGSAEHGHKTIRGF